MPGTYRLAAVAVAIVLAIAGAAAIWHLNNQLVLARAETAQAQESLKTAQALRKKDAATSVLRERLRAADAASAASAGRRLEAAVEAAPAWADQPVPQEVRDALAP